MEFAYVMKEKDPSIEELNKMISDIKREEDELLEYRSTQRYMRINKKNNKKGLVNKLISVVCA